MRINLFACAAMFAVMMPAAALADNPNDPSMRSAAARARDRAIIRQLNLNELAMVRERDARYAEGWRASRNGGGSAAANEEYARSRAQYERDMAEWRRAVAACREGDYSACDN